MSDFNASPSASQPGSNPLLTLISTLQRINLTLGAMTQQIAKSFPQWAPVPATAGSAGTAGQVAYDATHFYICIATNTWVRCAIATF
jgi:hypothetical protein